MLRLVSLKERLLTVRLTPDVHRDYKIAAELKGGTMSGLVHLFVVQLIREQKERNPEAFRSKRNETDRPLITARIKKPKPKQHRGSR